MKDERIERSIEVRAPRGRVWRALTDAREFGAWFGAELAGSFVVGGRITGHLTIPGHEGRPFEAVVERVLPEVTLAFRWPHDGIVDEHGRTPTTLVELRLDETPTGTRVTVTESGFEAIPAEMRAAVLRDNAGGWEYQLANIGRHVAG
jgi:uncharacterized protein YndB with AHSA1/START domain